MQIPAAVLQTILGSLASLFLPAANGDPTAAYHAAAHTIAGHHPETEDEYRLAAQIEIFGHQALQALAQAADPDLPLTRILRLRGSAVSLSRESHKAQRRLAQLQKSRRDGQPAEPLPPPAASAESAMALVQETARVKAAAIASGQTWTQAYKQHQREKRLANRLPKAQPNPLPIPVLA